MAFDSTRPLGFATRAIHHGYNPADNANALTPPLHLSSTFAFPTAEEGGALFAGETEGHVYSRISNPTVALLESRIADLEGAEAGLCTGSGMGAISATMWTLLKPGDEIITDQTLYGCTFAFMRDGLSRFGITITHVDVRDPENLRGAISDKTRIVYFESPANPNMRLVDIRAVSSIAHEHDTLVVVDNTYASPMLTRPLTLGADFVLHSATKYLGGHGDLVAGAVCGRADAIHEIRMVGVKDMTGSVMAPFNAMLVMRGLKTLQLRMARHCESGMKVAEWLEAQPGVSVVHYPGLVSHPQHELAKRQMDGFGGMVAFELEGGYEAGLAMMNRLRLIRRAVSLGDAETLIQHPASMTHSTYSPDERRAHGISEGLVRLSVGLEDVTDLIEDLAGALGTNDR
ncbi:MAG: methionine gamma-lyase [Alphaproteobacteria bacterium]|nr:methionine gamma-lyase [Alphaproteobacteria bacterium]MBU2144390.1 methionine gamma-lyase [Alphaproteobacteria bacterium]MBU2196352.1 methionine gamma-lyase [Alphaproteobacteria bacterium]